MGAKKPLESIPKTVECENCGAAKSEGPMMPDLDPEESDAYDEARRAVPDPDLEDDELFGEARRAVPNEDLEDDKDFEESRRAINW